MHKNKLIISAIFLLTLALDQLTKQLVLGAADGMHPQLITRIFPIMNIVLVWNSGVSFGLFSDYARWMPMILIAVTSLMTVGLAIWFWRTPRQLTALAIGLVISGAVGNIIDRIHYGAVIDFLDIHINSYHWPAFNVADSVIFIGVVLLVWESIVETGETKREEQNDS